MSLIGEINSYRLINQQIAESHFQKPEDIVRWMVAMQAQEYAMAKWAIGLRLPGSTDSAIENAFNNGAILRTHIMRPTWHFVSAEDIRWMIQLTSPRVHQANAFTYRSFELDKKTLNKCTAIIERSLAGGKHLTRTVLNNELKAKKITADGIRLSAIMMYAELEGIICSGPRQGKQFTYALLEERVKPVKKISREEGFVGLANRYFMSRGPATLQDFTTWSGLTVKEAKTGIEGIEKQFKTLEIDGKTYILAPGNHTHGKHHQLSFLMPDYDEYGMGYKDRSSILNQEARINSISRGNPVFNRMIILNGIIAGTWNRTLNKNAVHVETYPFYKLNQSDLLQLKHAVKKYVDFTVG